MEICEDCKQLDGFHAFYCKNPKMREATSKEIVHDYVYEQIRDWEDNPDNIEIEETDDDCFDVTFNLFYKKRHLSVFVRDEEIYCNNDNETDMSDIRYFWIFTLEGSNS